MSGESRCGAHQVYLYKFPLGSSLVAWLSKRFSYRGWRWSGPKPRPPLPKLARPKAATCSDLEEEMAILDVHIVIMFLLFWLP